MVSVPAGNTKPVQCEALLIREGMPDRRCYLAAGHERDHICFTGSNNLTWTNEEREAKNKKRKR